MEPLSNIMLKKWKASPMVNSGFSIRKWLKLSKLEISDNANFIIIGSVIKLGLSRRFSPIWRPNILSSSRWSIRNWKLCNSTINNKRVKIKKWCNQYQWITRLLITKCKNKIWFPLIWLTTRMNKNHLSTRLSLNFLFPATPSLEFPSLPLGGILGKLKDGLNATTYSYNGQTV